MLARGFAATSLDEVCAEAGLTKGCLFHYFGSKEELGAEVLEQYAARVHAKLDAARATQREPLRRVVACLEFLSGAAEVYPMRHGCLLGRLAQELSVTHPRIRARCAGHFERWIGSMAADLETAGLARADARSLAEYTVAALEGALVLARASGDCAVVRRTLDHVRNHLERAAAGRPRDGRGRRTR